MNGLPADYYLRQMNERLAAFDNPKVFMHACCAPCSSYCLLALRDVASLGVYYYNPNITLSEEYEYRYSEIKRLIGIYNDNPDRVLSEDCRQVDINKGYVNRNYINIIDGPYEPQLFMEKTKGYEACPERGERCSICFDLRLRKTAEEAKKLGYDFFATTLTLSPLKNADVINAIGERISSEVGIAYLPTDFKKKNGYKMSIELSKEFNLYRQNYCGCIFSKNKIEQNG
ncbi:MAG: epoxyqueuosine reductase QueH [Lachnospiraceae bacterium]|nr:epoxyqueuosine reductase QueH [Lachnospiraceae bacterium]